MTIVDHVTAHGGGSRCTSKANGGRAPGPDQMCGADGHGHGSFYLLLNSSLLKPSAKEFAHRSAAQTELGRAWGSNAHVVLQDTFLDSHIAPHGCEPPHLSCLRVLRSLTLRCAGALAQGGCMASADLVRRGHFASCAAMWWHTPPTSSCPQPAVHHCKTDATRCRALPIARRASLGGCSRTSPRAHRNDRVRFHLDTQSTTVPAAAA